MQPDQELMDRKVAHGVQGQRKSRAIAVNRGCDPAAAVLDSKGSTRFARSDPALDGPLDRRRGHGGPPEAQQLQGTDAERVRADPHKPECQVLDAAEVSVA